MKHGRRLKRKHKILLNYQGLNHKNYLVVKDTTELTMFIHRESGHVLNIYKV